LLQTPSGALTVLFTLRIIFRLGTEKIDTLRRAVS
jgi:hypothetical protein